MSPRTRRSLATSLVVSTAGVLLVVPGCNAILDNDPGILVTTEDGGAALPDDDRPDSGNVGRTPGPSPDGDPSPDGETPGPRPDAGTLADAGPSPCATGQRLCDGQCVAADDPTHGCGSSTCAPCAIAQGTATCRAGACAVATCDPGFADCNGRPEDGCEASLATPATCGSCTTACNALAPTCSPVGATFQCTNGCTPLAPARCGDECVDVQTSVNHCGACGVRCPEVANASAACTGGACTYTCRPDFNTCGGRCVPRTDPTACGPTCAVCPAPPNARATCVADACSATCLAGYADCDASPVNGCEAPLANDPLNCGVCGRSCNGGACVAGVCQPAPDAGAPPP